MKRLFSYFPLLLLCGCASRGLNTESGYPEITVEADVSAERIARATQEEMTRRGYQFAGWGQGGMVFERPPGEVGGEMYGGESSPTKLRVRVHIFRIEEGYKVLASGTVVTDLGAIKHEVAADRQGNRQLWEILKQIKKRLS